MIEWILTDNNVSIFDIIVVVIIAFIFVTAVLTALSVIGENLKTEIRAKIAYSLSALSALLFLSIVYIDKQIKTENVTEGDWVQIYSNDQKADINLYLKYAKPIKAGEVLTDDQLSTLKEIYSRNAIRDVTVVASKDDVEESRLSQIDGHNIELQLDKNVQLKITKVEYRKIVGEQKTLFGHKGPTTPTYLKGQIRLTIDGEKSDDSLKELFDGKKQ